MNSRLTLWRFQRGNRERLGSTHRVAQPSDLFSLTSSAPSQLLWMEDRFDKGIVR